MKSMIKRSNYSGRKFLITNIKKEKPEVLSAGGILKTFGVSSVWKDKTVKTYYDTPNMFFRKSGINISIDTFSNKSVADLVVRYDSLVERINFISNIPDTFIKKVKKSQPIDHHNEYIATAILEIIPRGLSVDIFELVKTLKPILRVKKKRERYRIIHNEGLKMVFSFENNTYQLMATGEKKTLPILDIRLESTDEYKKEFDEFAKSILFQHPQFLKQKQSDLFIGLDYLGE